MALEFVKYQGIGNDFMVVEAETERGFSSERVQQLCDRHFGVGADGVLIVELSAPAPEVPESRPGRTGSHGRAQRRWISPRDVRQRSTLCCTTPGRCERRDAPVDTD